MCASLALHGKIDWQLYWHHNIFIAIYHSFYFTWSAINERSHAVIHKKRKTQETCCLFCPHSLFFLAFFFPAALFLISPFIFEADVLLWSVFINKPAPVLHQPSYRSLAAVAHHNLLLFFSIAKTSKRWSRPWEKREPAEKQTHTHARRKKPTHLRTGNHRRPHSHLVLTSTHTCEETLGKLGIIQAVAA